jgi:hypothetical protein
MKPEYYQIIIIVLSFAVVIFALAAAVEASNVKSYYTLLRAGWKYKRTLAADEWIDLYQAPDESVWRILPEAVQRQKAIDLLRRLNLPECMEK